MTILIRHKGVTPISAGKGKHRYQRKVTAWRAGMYDHGS